MASQITCTLLFVKPFVYADIKENIKARVIGHLWVPLTKSQ